MTEANQAGNSYVFEAEDASEIARLIDRNTFFKRATGGPFPELPYLDGIVHILDIGCGPGGWAIDVAVRYPDKNVVGIDISETMLANARRDAKTSLLENTTFLKMDALQPLQFPDQSFDLVNMRAAIEYIPRKHWNSLLQECYRITRPGGILQLALTDRIAHTNSPAFERYHHFYTQMLHLNGYGFSPDGQTLGATPMLGKYLRDAGYQHIDMKSYAIDLSYNTMFQMNYQHLWAIRLGTVRSMLLEKQLITAQELEETYTALLDDIAQETFCGITYPLVFWGKK